MTDKYQNIQIEKNTKSLMIKSSLLVIVYIALFILFSIAFFYVLGFNFSNIISDHNNKIINLYLIIGVIFLIILGYLFERVYHAKDIYYSKFAKALGFHFGKHPELIINGILFNNYSVNENIIYGKINNNQFYFFDYHFKEKERDDCKSIMIIKTSIHFPKMFFTSINFFKVESINELFNYSLSKIKFMKSSFYIEKGFEIEALQVFCREFKMLLNEQYPDFSLEFNNQNIIIYHKKQINSKKDLIIIFQLAEHLIMKKINSLLSIEKDYLALKELQK